MGVFWLHWSYSLRFSNSTQDTSLENLDKKHFAKGVRVTEQYGVAKASSQVDNSKEIALMEAKIEKLCDLLHEVHIVSLRNILFQSYNSQRCQ